MAALTDIEANEMLVHENRNEVEVNNFEVEEGLPLFLNSKAVQTWMQYKHG